MHTRSFFVSVDPVPCIPNNCTNGRYEMDQCVCYQGWGGDDCDMSRHKQREKKTKQKQTKKKNKQE